MDAEEKKKFTGLLYRFRSGERVCETALRSFPKAIIDEAVELGYIKIVGINDIGKKLYSITDAGKLFW